MARPGPSIPTLREFIRRVGTLSDASARSWSSWWPAAPARRSAARLDISPRTVEIYRAKLMAKTQAGSLQELVRWAVLAGLA